MHIPTRLELLSKRSNRMLKIQLRALRRSWRQFDNKVMELERRHGKGCPQADWARSMREEVVGDAIWLHDELERRGIPYSER